MLKAEYIVYLCMHINMVITTQRWFNNLSTIIRINTECKCLIMKLGPAQHTTWKVLVTISNWQKYCISLNMYNYTDGESTQTQPLKWQYIIICQFLTFIWWYTHKKVNYIQEWIAESKAKYVFVRFQYNVLLFCIMKGMGQWVSHITRNHWMPVSREFKSHHRLSLIPWARNFTLIA